MNQEIGAEIVFKQWGGVNKKRTGRELDGRTYDEMPASLEDDGSRQLLPLFSSL